MKKLSIAALTAVSLFAGTFSLMPYGAYLNYSSKALKDKAYVGGIYGSFTKLPFMLEFDAEHTKIKYKDSTPDWNQNDLTFVGHYYKQDYGFKLGIHNMFINQTDNPEKYDKVFIGGVEYYKYLKYDAGVDYYFSKYLGFNVNQVSPKIGFYFGNYYAPQGLFYVEGKVDFIKISKKDEAPKDKYTDFNFKLVNSKGPWTTTLSGSIGKNAYKVANGGFVVYNLGDEYKFNGSLGISYRLKNAGTVKVEYSRAKYNNGTSDVYSNTYLISYMRAF
jgi:hypothetical protein